MIKNLEDLFVALNDFYYDTEDLWSDLKLKRKIDIYELINFPEYVKSTIEGLLDIIENIEEEKTIKSSIENKKIVTQTDLIIYKETVQDLCFQSIDKEWAKQLKIPEEYQEKSVAVLKYDADLTISYISGSDDVIRFYFYEFCIDENDGSSSDHWDSVNESDIVFKNNHCKIYKRKQV